MRRYSKLLAAGALAAAVALVVAAPASAAKPVNVSGSGSEVRTVRLKDGPLIVTARHNGESNFIVELVGKGRDHLIVNEIGDYKGKIAVRDVPAGRYRLAVDADGRWKVRIKYPPPRGGTRLARSFSGRGSKVIRVRVRDDVRPVLNARHRGDSNFIVELIGYGRARGEWFLAVNEIGSYRGETLLYEVPSGSYLLAVTADGKWRLRFRR